MVSSTITTTNRTHILLLPFPAQGHMLPLLDLAAHLSTATTLSITVAVTTANLPLLTPLLTSSPTITPLVLPFPTHPSIPPGIEHTQHLPPSSFPLMIFTLSALRHPLLLWSRSHPSPPAAIIADMFMGWSGDLAADLRIPHLVFSPSGALTISVANSLWIDNPDPAIDPVAFPALPGSPTYHWRHLSPMYRSYKPGDAAWETIKAGILNNIRSSGYVFNTFAALESRYLDYLSTRHRVWAVGPLCKPDVAGDRGGAASVPAEELLSWLDGFDTGSVIYVSFGSQAVLEPPQAAALAAGLEGSGARFVWCVKGGKGVPEGFEERTAGRGRVIRGWAPQVAALGHRAVGWFLTHCGWNSSLEAVAAGVAVLTWPMTADQFMNERVLVEEAGMGVKVCEGEDTVPNSEELAKILAEAVGGGERVERARAAEMKMKAELAVAEGGSSSKDMEKLVEMLAKQRGGSKVDEDEEESGGRSE